MATGDVKWFAQGLLDLGNKLHNLGSETLKLGIVNNTTVPTVSTSDPRWGAGGTTNFSTNQVGTGGTSYTGPLTLSSVTWALQSGVPTLRASNVSLSQDASGFTTGRYGIIYNDTDTGKRALAFIDFGATISLAAGPFAINWNAGVNTNILTLTQA